MSEEIKNALEKLDKKMIKKALVELGHKPGNVATAFCTGKIPKNMVPDLALAACLNRSFLMWPDKFNPDGSRK